MSCPEVSVVVPVYNLENYITETLESLKAQTFTDFEAIIVNDGSTDDSEKAVKPFLSDPRFRYVCQDNAGLACARNTALGMAEGTWFALLDGDDVWMPRKLELQMELALSDPWANIVYGNALVFHEISGECTAYHKSYTLQGDITPAIYRSNFLAASSVIVKTEKLRQIGGFRDQPYVEDYDAWLRLAHSGIWARTRREPVVRYRIRPGSLGSATIDALHVLIETLQRALEREERPHLARILRKSIARIRSTAAYEQAREAAKIGSPDVERYLWECWRLQPRRAKRLALASLCSLSRISRINAGWDTVMDRLRSNVTPWEVGAD